MGSTGETSTSAASRALRDLRYLGEATLLIGLAWLILGWFFDHPITQLDGTYFVAPYTQSSLDAGPDWTHHLYRFSVLGGSPMHAYAGTLPLTQLCSLLGLSTTATLNLNTVFLQLCFAFFGWKTVAALVEQWAEKPVALHWPQRVVAYLAFAFAPSLGARLGIGHENIVQGFIPFYVACSLVWSARAKQLSITTVLVGFFAIFNGVSGLGAQLLVYSAVFGLPVALVVVGDPRRWSPPIVVALATIASGVLVALPRLAPMIAFASSDDASRGLDAQVIFSFGRSTLHDWLTSVPWSAHFAGDALVHERNYPIGPFVALVLLLWSRRQLGLGCALAGSFVLVGLFACDVHPVSSTLLRLVPAMASFRVPARAILPLLALVPPLALARVWSQAPPEGNRLLDVGAVAIAGIILATHSIVPTLAYEPIAWGLCLVLAIATRRSSSLAVRHGTVGIAIVAAIGALACRERIPRGIPFDPIENGPARVRRQVLAHSPELASPLDRISIVKAPLPYRSSLGFAAKLSTLDGDYNPTRRFLALLSALGDRELPPTTVIFDLGRDPRFAVLQQLYNVKLELSAADGAFTNLPATPGPAWFPAHVETAPDRATVARALLAHPSDAGSIAWLLEGDHVTAPPTCTGTVEHVATDALGQTATFDVTTTTDCTLVVAANYVSTLRATDAGRPLRVFPIDIALTGIAVPPGHTTVTLAPHVAIPLWARIASILGWLLVAATVLAPLLERAHDRVRDRRSVV